MPALPPVADIDDEWGADHVGAEWSASPDAPDPEPVPERRPMARPVVSPDDAEGVAAVRTVWMLVGAAGLAVVGIVAVLLSGILVPDSEERGAGAGTDNPAIVPSGPAAVGPASGADVTAYAASAVENLAAADGTRVAVVSLTSYRSAESVDAVLASGGEVEVLGRLVAAPGGFPELVTGDLSAWADEERATAQAERDEIARILPTVEAGSEFIPAYEEDIRRYDALLAGLDPAGELVFGVVVRAPVGVLRGLVAQAELRLVDVGRTDFFDADGDYRGIRPEETTTAGTPRTRP